ncbi:hypothetical protein ABIE52_003705 [Rhodococcus sp. OAS809]
MTETAEIVGSAVLLIIGIVWIVFGRPKDER